MSAKKPELVRPLTVGAKRLRPQRLRFVMWTVAVTQRAADDPLTALVKDHCVVPDGESMRQIECSPRADGVRH